MGTHLGVPKAATGDRRTTVVIPSYNHAPYIEQAVRSVWAQTHPDVELIVVDDCSTDDSRHVLRSLLHERAFLLLENANNMGLNPALERGIESATGEFIGILASDDFIAPNKIERQVAHLEENALDAVYAGGWVLRVDGVRELLDTAEIASAFARGDALRLLRTRDTCGPLQQSGLFRTHVMRELLPVRRRFRSDDWALAISLLERFAVDFLDEPLFTYRHHESNTHRNYWLTFPMRVEVVCSLTPDPLRDEALANLLESQSAYLWHGGSRRRALCYRAAAVALNPGRTRLKRAARAVTLRTVQRLRRT